MKNWLKRARKSTLSSGKIIVTKYSEIEMKQTITFMKSVNQPVMNAAQQMKLKMRRRKKYSIVEKADLILKKDMEHKEITRIKENLNIGKPQYKKELRKCNGN